MNILGFNPSHHGSVCLLQDGEIKYFIQEERIGNRRKYISHPFRSFIDILQNNKIDYITWGTPSMFFPNEYNFPHSPSIDPTHSIWANIQLTYQTNSLVKDYSFNSHHKVHASHAFYNSGFKESLVIVIDGLGSQFYKNSNYTGTETESIYYCSYPSNFQILHKTLTNTGKDINLSRVYETITQYLGWSINEAGKTMGLSSYSTLTNNLPSLFRNIHGNPDIFLGGPPQPTIRFDKYPQLRLKTNPTNWHYDRSKITNLEKNLARKVQLETQQITGDYIEKSIKETGLKKVCCAGGYFLNCVTNYYLKKRFPDVDFYFEPIANDAGTAIGAAKLLWHELTQDTTIRPFKSLYLGPQYSKKQLLEGIQKYVSN